MSIAPYQFRPVRMGCPLDNLTIAMGLIQTEILAGDTGYHPEVMFGKYHFKQCSLELAVALLAPLLDEVDNLSWPPE